MPYTAQVKHLPADEKLEVREYLNYEQREPCQFYQPLPQGFMQKGCHIIPEQPPVLQAQSTPVQAQRAVKREVLADYEVHFGFDNAAIEPAAGDILDKVADDIKRHHPGEVTVAGHADRSGPSDYNVALSQKRAQAVSDALTSRGVTHRVLDEEAHGENDPKIPTPDGTKLRENRRVEIEFLK